TEYQLVDIFTKALPEDRLKYLVRRIDQIKCKQYVSVQDINHDQLKNTTKRLKESLDIQEPTTTLKAETGSIHMLSIFTKTKIELTLEQSQQGVSNDVLVSIEGAEELKINVWIKTKIELTLEQSQQGVSNDVLSSIEGVEELKRNVWINGENKAALHYN
nr:hypothetical protein [Tanacetum cinerariifolium]